MAKPDLGSKHKCQNCGTKFFDMNKAPITCPKCGTIFQVAASSAAARAPSGNADPDEEEAEPETGAEVVSLEEADTVEGGKVTAVDPDEDVEEEAAVADDDDTFLEEEEEDDPNVSDLIDGDIEDDDER